ncbi:hypothetical protein GGR57DRAFT_461776 [Xylariaceae sp. FL1272]|nr:hypothetical protein GGR57DRAFT_461776 [Xylariaceae sp. FL1272]
MMFSMSNHLPSKEPDSQMKLITTTHTNTEFVYCYTQVFCGFCGRFITDLGGFVLPGFSKSIAKGERNSPGLDALRLQPDLFTSELRANVALEKQPQGLPAAINWMVQVQPDLLFPRIFLQPQHCYHNVNEDELRKLGELRDLGAKDGRGKGKGKGKEKEKIGSKGADGFTRVV